MLKDITIGQYVPGDSFVHRLDPRTKIIISLGVMIGLFMVKDLWGYLCMTLFALMVISMAQIPGSYIIKGLRPLFLIMLITLVAHSFMTEGTPLIQIGPLTVTIEGLKQGVSMVWRLILLIVFTSLLTLTTSPLALTGGIEQLLKPGERIGIPAHEIAMMMTIALRFIPTLLDEAERIMKAQMARGADFEEGSIFARARNLVPLLVPLFVSAFRRADELAVAMEARCYRGGAGRTRYKELQLGPMDYMAGAVSAVIITLIVTLV
jgi:energy-coupling factor transport system permease protein